MVYRCSYSKLYPDPHFYMRKFFILNEDNLLHEDSFEYSIKSAEFIRKGWIKLSDKEVEDINVVK